MTCSTVAERTVPASKQAIFTEISVDISVSPLPSHSFPFLLLAGREKMIINHLIISHEKLFCYFYLEILVNRYINFNLNKSMP